MARHPKDGNKTQDRVNGALDDLSDFEAYKKEIAPKIRQLLQKGASAQEIMEFAQSYAAARMVSLVWSEDSGKAMVAAKDVIDRAVGKAKERQEHNHKFEKLKDEELDSILLSKLKGHEDLTDDDSTEH